jgi:hypothetical protein
VVHIFTIATLFAMSFQVALAFGAPWGERAWGGKYPGVLPLRMRLASALSAVILCVFVVIMQTRAGNMFEELRELSYPLSWVVVGYSALGMVMNTITPSKKERNLWLPIVTLLFVTALVVVLSV